MTRYRQVGFLILLLVFGISLSSFGLSSPAEDPVVEAEENFESMPVWSSSYSATWGSEATWSIELAGQSGYFLQATRATGGSTTLVQVLDVPSNAAVTVLIYMKCPTFVGNYWMELGYKLGEQTGEDFDQNSATWVMVQKFANDGTNGNNNTWTQYSSALNTGSNTQLSIGFKLGSFGNPGPTVGWDSLRILSTGVPTATPTRTHTPVGPTPTPTPIGPDFDGDGIADSLEMGPSVLAGKTNMYLPDSDGDGLWDGVEDANRNGSHNEPEETNPRLWDSDQDGFEDGIEVLLLGSDPLNGSSPGTPYVDGDHDGLPNSIDPDDGDADIDGDRFLDGYEAVVLGLTAVQDANLKPALADVDNNQVWDNADSQLVLNFFGNAPTNENFTPINSDANRDGYIDNADSQLILLYFGLAIPNLPYAPPNP